MSTYSYRHLPIRPELIALVTAAGVAHDGLAEADLGDLRRNLELGESKSSNEGLSGVSSSPSTLFVSACSEQP